VENFKKLGFCRVFWLAQIVFAYTLNYEIEIICGVSALEIAAEDCIS